MYASFCMLIYNGHCAVFMSIFFFVIINRYRTSGNNSVKIQHFGQKIIFLSLLYLIPNEICDVNEGFHGFDFHVSLMKATVKY